MSNDTTGTKVAYYTDMGTTICIAEDIGAYRGCNPEYNVRSLRSIARLEGVTVTNPVFKSVTDNKQGYGCGWGDTGTLYPVSDSEIDLLLKEKARIDRAKESYDKGMVINPLYAHMTAEQLRAAEASYDKLHNEGGDGYNPYRDNLWVSED